MYTWEVPKNKKPKQAENGMGTNVTLVTEDEASSEEESDAEFDEGGMFLEKEAVKLIYNALRTYKPTEDEDHLHSVLLNEFEEILRLITMSPLMSIRKYGWQASGICCFPEPL